MKPVNGHILIEPMKHERFISSSKGTYEEIGVVLDTGEHEWLGMPNVGDKVFFDSWLAAKYPKNDTEFYWLVAWEDVRAIERHVK